MPRRLKILLLGACFLLAPLPAARSISGGHGTPPPPGSANLTPEATRSQIGDFVQWWFLNRDEFLLELKPAGDLSEYEKASPDTVPVLLSLVGYEGHFASIVKELGLRRLKRIPKVRGALAAILNDAKAPAAQRSWAAYALGDLKVTNAIPDLKAVLRHKDLNLRGFSALALSRMEDASGWDAILPLAEDAQEDENLRCLVVLGLAPCQDPRVRDALVRILDDKKGAGLPVRRAVLMSLGVKPRDGDVQVLTGFCKDSDPHIREAALLGLGLSGQGGETLRRLLVAKGKEKERDAGARAYAALALGVSASSENADVLLQVMEKEKDFLVRGCAALALGRIKAPEVQEALEKALYDRNGSFVSSYAAVALGLSRKSEAIAPLVKGTESKSASLIVACVVGLSILGDAKTLPPLLKAAEHPHYGDVQEFACVGLGRLGNPGGFPKLLENLREKAAGLRHASAIGLAVYGNPKACPDLEKNLDDKDPLVRSGAALAFDLLTDDPQRALTLGSEFKVDPRNATCRKVGIPEIQRLLNRYLPKEYKLPVTP